MVDDDQSSKTEEPTSRRLQQARERGQVAQSQDVRTWAVLVGGTLALAVLAPPAARRLVRDCLRFIEGPARIGLGVAESQAGLAHVVGDVGWLLAPTLLLLAALGLGSALAQSGLIWAPNRVQPEFGKISPLKGWQRLVSTNALVEFAKGLLKLSAMTVVMAALLIPALAGAETWPGFSLAHTVDRATRLLVRVCGGAAAVMTILAIVDYAYQRFGFLKQADDQAGVAGRVQAWKAIPSSRRAFVGCVRNKRKR